MFFLVIVHDRQFNCLQDSYGNRKIDLQTDNINTNNNIQDTDIQGLVSLDALVPLLLVLQMKTYSLMFFK